MRQMARSPQPGAGEGPCGAGGRGLLISRQKVEYGVVRGLCRVTGGATEPWKSWGRFPEGQRST